MPRHELSLKIENSIPVVNTDIKIEVHVDGAKLGTVKISRGSIDWLPSRASKSGYRLTWTQFARLMEESGRPL
ncbi:hypothetical protein G3I24_48455 [Micromonospora aurantiaca]|nr:hypothetical protein [Micromonospora aurantiaca]